MGYDGPLSEFRVGLAQHAVTGELYIARYVSLWDVNDQCVVTRVVAYAGPLHYTDLGLDHQPDYQDEGDVDSVLQALRDADLYGADAESLDAEDQAGQLDWKIVSLAEETIAPVTQMGTDWPAYAQLVRNGTHDWLVLVVCRGTATQFSRHRTRREALAHWRRLTGER